MPAGALPNCHRLHCETYSTPPSRGWGRFAARLGRRDDYIRGEMTSGEEEQRGRKRKMEEAGTREGGIAS